MPRNFKSDFNNELVPNLSLRQVQIIYGDTAETLSTLRELNKKIAESNLAVRIRQVLEFSATTTNYTTSSKGFEAHEAKVAQALLEELI